MSRLEVAFGDGDASGLACIRVRDPSLSRLSPGQATASIILAGDLFWPPVRQDEDQAQFAEAQHPWAPFVPLIEAQDLGIVNLESPLTESADRIVKAGPSMRSLPSFAPDIRTGGFGAVSLANNHIRDYGDVGIRDTLTTCQAAGLATVGAGLDITEAERPLVLSIGGREIGVLSFAEGDMGAADRRKGGAAPLRNGRAHAAVARVRANVDGLVVLLHAGTEFYPFPAPYLVELARSFANAGASAVVVHHQHVPSGVEVYEGVPIAYGTGNFLFRMYYPYKVREFHEGYLVQLELCGAGVTEFTLFPYFQSRGRRRVEAMSEEDARSLAARLRQRSSVLANDDALEATWRQHCVGERARYLAALLGMSRFERRLVRLLGLWPWWRMRPDRVAALTTLLSSESHREAAVAILEDELARTKLPSKTVH